MEPHYRGGAATGTSTASVTPAMQPGTPVSESRNPFGEDGSPAPRSNPNPFTSPFVSRPASSYASSSAVRGLPQRYFHSRRVRKGEVEQPWKEKKDPREKWVTIIPLFGILAGLAIAGFLVYDGYSSVIQHKYCPVLYDDFSNGFNTDIWTKEVEVGGFGNGEFEETTATDENVFIEDGKLIIKPTLQEASLIEKNSVLNLTADGSCTSTIISNCVSVTNTTNGTIVQPVKSGRINTKKGASIKYGRVEVTARLPAGDWLWPAIWMLPVEDTYGAWPASGEIDIMESRGNNYTYSLGGNNIITSTLHWGPDSSNDAFWRTTAGKKALRSTYADKEHTFGIEWSEKYIFMYVDSRLQQVMYNGFNKPLWELGDFPLTTSNGTAVVDPWSQTGRDQTPFDQKFYLIISLAVGGTNGWFKDGKAGKPWVDASPYAKSDFWTSRNQWYPTWTDNGQLTVSKVQMWQQCDGGEL